MFQPVGHDAKGENLNISNGVSTAFAICDNAG